jgi:3-oxoadipate enol-lactonase
MPTLRANELDIYYECHGSGDRLLLIGGSGGDLRQTPSVFSGPLAERFQLLSYDQRGLGRSSKPNRPYSMEDYAEDAAGLLEKLGWAREEPRAQWEAAGNSKRE